MPSPTRTMTSALTDAEYAVLGLLTSGDASGYELSASAQRNVNLILAPAKSRIYSVLPRLLARGLVERDEVRQATRPDKYVYRLSDAGWNALRAWLDDTAGAPTRQQLLLKLFFGEHADRDSLLAQLRDFRVRTAEELAMFQEIERRNLDRGLFFPNLTVSWALAMDRALLRWADRTVEAIEAR